jgi:choline dehydrogenase
VAASEFDVVVVGGGSAGCAVAGRLCATTDFRVCLVEAGPDYGPISEGYWPNELLDARIQPTTHDWGYAEERDDGSTAAEPRAKVIGGCSTHNECPAVWGVPQDYDRWAARGNPGWAYADLRPLIDHVEQCGQADAPYRGHRGSLPTRIYADEELSAWQLAFLQAADAATFPRLPDLSAPDPPQGVAPIHANVLDHTRWNAALAFLDPVRELPTLSVFDLTTADRLLFDQENATELICRGGPGEIDLAARVFILAAGTYGSPPILLRSGIGPGDHLTEMGISVVNEAPGVGESA